MGPHARQIMQSPMFRQMITNPDMMRQAMQMRGAMGGANAGGGAGAGAGAPGLFGLAQQQAQGGGAATTGGAAPHLSSLFGPGSPFGQMANAGAAPTGEAGSNPAGGLPPNFAQQMAAMQQMLGGQGGGFGGAPAANDSRPAEERYANELEQLRNMGFGNARDNVRAILAAGGDVEMAIACVQSMPVTDLRSYLLEGPPPGQ